MTLTITDFFRKFPTDDACLEHLWQVRFGDSVECEKCGKVGKFHRLSKAPAYSCPRCGDHIHPMVGTPFARSHTPLQKWFYALYLFTTTRHGVSAKELQRQLGVTYKTAWRMGHEIRKYMAKVDGDGTLDGIVELDEAYIGGRAVGGKKHGLTGRGTKKAIVFGMMERNGEVITRVVEHASRKEMLPHVAKHVEPGTHISTGRMARLQGASGDGIHARDGPAPRQAICQRLGSCEQYRSLLVDPEAVDPRDPCLGFEETSVKIPWRVRVSLQHAEAS